LLEMHREVGKAVQLMEDGHHVRLAIGVPIEGCNVGLG
jgi:hypothetical protein